MLTQFRLVGSNVLAHCAIHWHICFFSLVPPNFSTKKKTASQPIRAAVPVNPVTEEGPDWLLGGDSFWS